MNEQDPKPGFWGDERGAVFVEFIIVLYAFVFILLGVVQTGLMVCGSFYTNYANFMALRTAAVWLEHKEDGIISQDELNGTGGKCRLAALRALKPMERYLFKNPTNTGARDRALGRINFILTEGGEAFDGESKFIDGRLEYEYPLIVPFVGRVISALAKGTGAPSAENEIRVGRNFAYDVEGIGERYPTVTLRSNNELAQGGSPPRPHRMAVQRRWKYTTVVD
jgi:hypothetical protein